MAIKTSSYGTCHQCKALNMAHRTTCYRCGSTITPPISTALSGHAVTIAPREAAKVDRRQVRRHDVNLPGAVLAQNGEELARITVRNIGIGGLLFDSSEPFQLHDQLILSLEMEGEEYIAEAVVKHCGRVLSNVTPYSSGVEFLKPNGALISCISRLENAERETWS